MLEISFRNNERTVKTQFFVIFRKDKYCIFVYNKFEYAK